MSIKTDSLLDKLDKIPLTRVDNAAFRALMRLQLWFTGETHRIMLDFGKGAMAEIVRRADDDGLLDGGTAFLAQTEINNVWGDAWKLWMDTFERARKEAAQIAFGVQAQYHDRLVLPVVEKFITDSDGAITESVGGGVYDPQLRILLNVAGEYLYGDNLNLSGRIWRIDRETRNGINAVLLNGVQSGDSAWNIAKQLEQFLGAGQDCPRWAKDRLYGMSASDRTTSARGLFTGADCSGQGVSHNALRLARTEIQKIHNLANDRMMAQEPWVKEEQIYLSAAHPKKDICDDVVNKNDGVYPKGEIELPLHPNCLCRKAAVLVSKKEFTDELNGWLNGTQDSATFDAYARDLGVDLSTSLRPESINLAVWLLSNDLDEWMEL